MVAPPSLPATNRAFRNASSVQLAAVPSPTTIAAIAGTGNANAATSRSPTRDSAKSGRNLGVILPLTNHKRRPPPRAILTARAHLTAEHLTCSTTRAQPASAPARSSSHHKIGERPHLRRLAGRVGY